jgi:hypothetical protein
MCIYTYNICTYIYVCLLRDRIKGGWREVEGRERERARRQYKYQVAFDVVVQGKEGKALKALKD